MQTHKEISGCIAQQAGRHQQGHKGCWGVGLVFLIICLPVFATPATTADIVALPVDGTALQPVNDATLQNSHGKGIDPDQVHAPQLSIILWDEAGASGGRSAGGSTGSGNIQTVGLSLNAGGGK